MCEIVSIRRATLEDIDSIARVQIDSSRTTYKGIMPDKYLNNLNYEKKAARWKTRLFGDNPIEIAFVAVNRNSDFNMNSNSTKIDDIVGFVSIGIEKTHEIYERELNSLYILENFQLKGIGKLLFKEVLNELKKENINSFFLWVLEENNARNFYEKFGGELIGNKIIKRGGKMLKSLAYAWKNINL